MLCGGAAFELVRGGGVAGLPSKGWGSSFWTTAVSGVPLVWRIRGSAGASKAKFSLVSYMPLAIGIFGFFLP